MVNHMVRVENGLGFLTVLYMYMSFDFHLGLFFLLLLVPDITMLGYLFNKRVGVVIYNCGHSLILPFFLVAYSLYFTNNSLLFLSLIWLAHIFMDRFFGFGLKYSDSFRKTHLQRL